MSRLHPFIRWVGTRLVLSAFILVGAQSIACADSVSPTTTDIPGPEATDTVTAPGAISPETSVSPAVPIEPPSAPLPPPMTVPTKPPVSPVAPSSPKVRSLPEQATLIAKKYKIPPKLFLALVRQESRWNYRAVSKKGALGLTQVMPHNVKALGYKLSRFKTSPGAQLEAGARILNTEYKRFCRWDLALAAYNAGSGAVRKYAGIPPYRETITYVRRIIGAAS